MTYFIMLQFNCLKKKKRKKKQERKIQNNVQKLRFILRSFPVLIAKINKKSDGRTSLVINIELPKTPNHFLFSGL